MIANAISSMCSALGANGPSQEFIGKADIFGWLVGAWELEVLDSESEGVHRVNDGEWHFAWVLEGRAIQDVLITPRLAERRGVLPVRGNRYGSGFRVYDAKQNLWRGFWINPVRGTIDMLHIEKRGDEIVETGANTRCVFSAIMCESFCYTVEEKRDRAWNKIAQIRAQRTA